MLACKNVQIAIGRRISFDMEIAQRIIPFEYLYVENDCNGMKIKQTTHYIEMSWENYIQWLLHSHGWKYSSSKFDNDDIEPTTASPTSAAVERLHILDLYANRRDVVNDDKKMNFFTSWKQWGRCLQIVMIKLYQAKEGTTYHTAFKKKAWFSYRTLLEDLMYAYVTCWFAIEYIVTTLLKFSLSFSLLYYKLLKNVEECLKATLD